METRTKLNITSNEQFPPLKQTVTKELYKKGRNNTSDNGNLIQGFGPQLNKQNYRNKEQQNEEINKEKKPNNRTKPKIKIK